MQYSVVFACEALVVIPMIRDKSYLPTHVVQADEGGQFAEWTVIINFFPTSDMEVSVFLLFCIFDSM